MKKMFAALTVLTLVFGTVALAAPANASKVYLSRQTRTRAGIIETVFGLTEPAFVAGDDNDRHASDRASCPGDRRHRQRRPGATRLG